MLAEFKHSFERKVVPVIAILNWAGFTPNRLSALALTFALLSALSYYTHHLITALVLLASSALLDALDGPLARMLNKASPRGDLVDHAFDRFADAAIMAGIILGGLTGYEVGLLAVMGTMLTSYMGTQAQALGVGRIYGGLSGRADRIAIISTATLLEVFGYSALNFAMLVIGILGIATAIQRFAITYRLLGEGDVLEVESALGYEKNEKEEAVARSTGS